MTRRLSVKARLKLARWCRLCTTFAFDLLHDFSSVPVVKEDRTHSTKERGENPPCVPWPAIR